MNEVIDKDSIIIIILQNLIKRPNLFQTEKRIGIKKNVKFDGSIWNEVNLFIEKPIRSMPTSPLKYDERSGVIV